MEPTQELCIAIAPAAQYSERAMGSYEQMSETKSLIKTTLPGPEILGDAMNDPGVYISYLDT